MSRNSFPGTPLFDSLVYFSALGRGAVYPDDSPSIQRFIEALPHADAAHADYCHAKDFLTSYSRRSQDTFDKFRSDVERFLLWCWLVAGKCVPSIRRQDLEAFIDFVMKPPKAWTARTTNPRFLAHDGLRQPNDRWRPFRDIGTGARLNNKSLQGLYANLSIFFNFMVETDYCLGNPVPIVKKNCRYLVVDTAQKETRRLSSLQWEALLQAAQSLARERDEGHRSLFVVAALKSLKLRISELSARPNWVPLMDHFHQDHQGNWWFKAFGKGKKLREVSVSTGFLTYLKSYRQSMGLSPLPSADENIPLIPSLRGGHGLKSRQLRNLFENVIERAASDLITDGFEEDARRLRIATTHWLRHTGASMEVAAGRPLRHVQADLGHESIRTTDMLYVSSDDSERAHSSLDIDV